MAPLKIGVMMETVQSSDIMGADIIGNCSTEYATALAEWGAPGMLEEAKDMEFYWISDTLEPARMTPGMKIVPNATYNDAPRDLWVLLIGGPLLSHRPAAGDKFMKEAYPRTKHVLTTCIGSMWLASSGVLDGKKATTNRGALEAAKKMHPKTEWLDQRWVVDEDGHLWTAGGAIAGM